MITQFPTAALGRVGHGPLPADPAALTAARRGCVISGRRETLVTRHMAEVAFLAYIGPSRRDISGRGVLPRMEICLLSCSIEDHFIRETYSSEGRRPVVPYF